MSEVVSGSERGVATDVAALRRQLAARGATMSGDPLGSVQVRDLYIMHSFACHLRCDYCWLWGETGMLWDKQLRRQYKDRVGLDAMRRFIDAVVPFGLQSFNLSGGEPLMNPMWRDLAAHARSIGLPVMLTTGGVLVGQELDGIMGGLDQLNVSMNGPPSIADVVRPGPEGHYAQTIRGLAELSARKRAGEPGPLLRVLATLTHTNYRHIIEMMDYVEAEGIDVDEWYFQFLIYNSAEELDAQEVIHREEFGRGVDMLRTFSVKPLAIDFDVMWAEIEAARKRHPRVQFSAPLTRETLERYYTDRKWGIVPNTCGVPWTDCVLMPNGDVYTCPDLPIGNILEEDFADIWNGAKARRLRERLTHNLFPTCTGCFHYWGDRGIELDRERRATG